MIQILKYKKHPFPYLSFWYRYWEGVAINNPVSFSKANRCSCVRTWLRNKNVRKKENRATWQLVAFKILTAVVTKFSIFWNTTACIQLKVDLRFTPSTLKMEEIYSSKTSVDFQQNTCHYIPEEEVLKTRKSWCIWIWIISSAYFVDDCTWFMTAKYRGYLLWLQLSGWNNTDSACYEGLKEIRQTTKREKNISVCV
jgi:hypothetical protein